MNEIQLYEDPEEKINPFLLLRRKMKHNGKDVTVRDLEILFEGKIKYTHISALERGYENPSLFQLKIYHDFFGVSYEFLLGETDVPDISKVEKKYSMCDLEYSIDYLRTRKTNEDRLIYQTVRMLLTSEKGLAILYYLSRLFFGKKGTGNYETKGDILYYTEQNYDDDYMSHNTGCSLKKIKIAPSGLSYFEYKMCADQIKKEP